MKTECIECLINCNREIEFSYLNKRYSITYLTVKGKRTILFCEFYKEPINVQNPYDVLNLKIGKLTLQQIFAKLPDSAFDIY